MITRVQLPKLAETTDVLVLEQWLVGIGDRVEVDQPIASIETDKVTVELPSPIAGTITEFLVNPDDEVHTGDDVCAIES